MNVKNMKLLFVQYSLICLQKLVQISYKIDMLLTGSLPSHVFFTPLQPHFWPPIATGSVIYCTRRGIFVTFRKLPIWFSFQYLIIEILYNISENNYAPNNTSSITEGNQKYSFWLPTLQPVIREG